MIKTIELQNFQSHLRTRIPLGSFTAIVGQSSSGKTSVMRALLWVFYGDWDDTYPQDPAKPTAVAVELESGAKIVRMRLGDENKAIIIMPGEPEPRKYKDFGYIIPGVFDLINLRPIQSGKQKINLNFSTQDEPLFMLSDAYSKPARAQWLGRLYGAHVVNNMLRLMAKDKKDAEATCKALDTEYKGLQDTLKSFEGLEVQEKLLTDSEADLACLATLEGLSTDLSQFRLQVDILKRRRWVMDINTDWLRKAIEKLSLLKEIKEKLCNNNNLDNKLKSKENLLRTDLKGLKAMVDQLSGLKSIVQAKEEVEHNRGRLEFKKWVLDFDTAGLRKDLASLEALREIHKQANSAGLKLNMAVAKSMQLDKKLVSLKSDVKQQMFGDGKCLLCGSDSGNKVSAEFAARNLKFLMEG